VRGDIEDRGAWYVVQDSRASLEIYRASSSFRFVREDIDGEGRNGTATQVDPRRAVALAERFLEDTGRPPATIDVQSVTELEVLSMAQGSREPTRTIVSLQVNFRLSVDGVPLVARGARSR